MHEGDLRITKDWYIEYGYPIGFPSIELGLIGAGGGSLAWWTKAVLYAMALKVQARFLDLLAIAGVEA